MCIQYLISDAWIKISIIDLLHNSLYIVFLVSNSPLIPASQEAVQNESKQTHSGLDSKQDHYRSIIFWVKCKTYIFASIYAEDKKIKPIQTVNNLRMLYGA